MKLMPSFSFNIKYHLMQAFQWSGTKKGSRLLLTHRNGIEKVWANKLSHQKEIDMIPYSLFGFGVPIPMNRDVGGMRKAPPYTPKKKIHRSVDEPLE